MILDICPGKKAQVAADGSLSIYTVPNNIAFLTSIETEKFKRWLNEVIPDGRS
ncbi:hypothetical protein METP3_03037 [Methanosarcinales archaeon]|nr:hypothetical protein METP3_03037 [Methanosarcinales archaeon]